MSQFSHEDKEDLKEFFRVHNFSKVSKIDDEVTAAEAKGLTPKSLFADLYKLYGVASLPDRDAVSQRLKAAVPDASDADIESILRHTEVKGLQERDAKRALERRLGIKHMTDLPEEKKHAEAETEAAADEVRKAVAALNHVERPAPGQCREEEKEESHVAEMRRASQNLHHVAPTTAPGERSGEASHMAEVRRASQKLHHVDPNAAPDVAESSSSHSEVQKAVASLKHVDTNQNRSTDSSDTSAAKRQPVKLNAAPTKATMDEIVTEEVREWIAKMVGDTYNKEVLAQKNLCEALRDGVVLHVLLQKMQKPPVPDSELKVPKRTTGFFMRDNVNVFLTEARKRYNLLDAQIFIESDLVDLKHERQVITCLMSIARIAYAQGSIDVAPSIIMYEKEIDQRGSVGKEELERIVDEAEQEAEQAAGAEQEGEPATPPVEHAEEEQKEDQAAPRVEESAQTEVAEGTSSPAEEKNEEAPAVAAPEPAQKEETIQKPAVAEPLTSAIALQEETQAENKAAQEETTETPQEQKAAEDSASDEKKAAVDEKGVFYLRQGALATKDKEGQLQKKPLVVVKDEPGALGSNRPPVYFSRHWDGIDVEVGKFVNAHYKRYPASPWRMRGLASNAGEYVLYNRDNGSKRMIFIRILQHKPFVRKSQGPGGPSWMLLPDQLEELEHESLK